MEQKLVASSKKTKFFFFMLPFRVFEQKEEIDRLGLRCLDNISETIHARRLLSTSFCPLSSLTFSLGKYL